MSAAPPLGVQEAAAGKRRLCRGLVLGASPLHEGEQGEAFSNFIHKKRRETAGVGVWRFGLAFGLSRSPGSA